MLKVLFFNRDHSLWMGGDAMQLDATRCALEALGVQTTYSSDLTIDLMPFDVVHLFHLNFQWTATLARRCREAGKPYVVSAIFFPEVRDVSAAEMRTIVEHSHATMVFSAAERDLIVRATGADARQMCIVPNGIDHQVWNRGRRRFGPILTFARLTPAKGLIHAAQACCELGIPYVVFGPGAGYPQYEDDLRQLGARLLGAHRQAVLATAARMASVFVCPSFSDVQSLSVLEAAQCGLPIVDSIHNPGASLLPSSMIVDPSDHQALVHAIRTQRAAPDNTDRVPTWDDVARQVLALYPT